MPTESPPSRKFAVKLPAFIPDAREPVVQRVLNRASEDRASEVVSGVHHDPAHQAVPDPASGYVK